VEDRNRTAPFPFCGNRFEFRAVGSSQNCAFPTAICNTVWAAGAAYLADKIEKGASLRDAVAATFKECRPIIFTGNGYSKEWPVEAQKRGLPNLRTTPEAIAAFTGAKSKQALTSMKIFSNDECEAFSETMYENYVTTLSIEVQTMQDMVSSGFLPAMAQDLAIYRDAPELAGDRKDLYAAVLAENKKLEALMAKMPSGLVEEAKYLCNTVKPQMESLRSKVDQAETQMQVYPYPNYEQMLYGHHF
jgi:glutamine synthetase